MIAVRVGEVIEDLDEVRDTENVTLPVVEKVAIGDPVKKSLLEEDPVKKSLLEEDPDTDTENVGFSV